MTKKIIILSLPMLFAVACAQKQKSGDLIDAKKATQEKTTENKSDADLMYTCTVNKDTRIIEMDKTPKRCEVHYTKFGEKAQVAWAENTPSICKDVYGKIKENIESKGFKCDSKTETAENTKQPERDSASIK